MAGVARLCAHPQKARIRGALHEFGNSAIGLVDGDVSVGGGAGVGVGDGDTAEALAANLVWRLSRRPIRIEQGIVFVAVTVGPAVDGDGFDVARGIKPAGGERAGELVANLALEDLERRDEEFHSPGFVLLARGEARFAGSAAEMDEDRLFG